MTRVTGWLRLLLLASLLAGPRLGPRPADTPARSAWLVDDGLTALAARPTQHLRILVPSLGGGTSPQRAPAQGLPALLLSIPGDRIAPSGADAAPPFPAAVRGAGSPRFPTGPPAALPTD